MQYRKVKKVPAKGISIPATENRATNSFRGQHEKSDSALLKKDIITPAIVDSIIIPQVITANKKSLLRKKTNEKVKQISRRNSNLKSPEKTNRSLGPRRSDGVGLLIVLFLLLGLLMIIAGAWILVAGIYVLLWWLIGIGIVLIFLGLLPFLGLIGFIVGDRHKSAPAYQYQEK